MGEDFEHRPLWRQVGPWLFAALIASVVPVLWALLFGVAPSSFDSEEQTGYLLAEALNLRRLISIMYLAVGVVLSIPSICAVFRTSGWRTRAAYLCSTLAIGVLCFVFPLLSTFWTLVWISGEIPTRRPFLWAFFGYHDPRLMILEYALPIPMTSMALAALSLLIRWSHAGAYVVAGSVVIFIALLVLIAPMAD
jgi:hypothetical protein